MNQRLIAMLVAANLLAGCGSSDQAGASATQGGATPKTAAGADAVAAVLQSAGTPVAKLGFALSAVPAVGAAVEMRLDVSAAAPTVLQLVAEGDGLVVDAATARTRVSVPADGARVSHSLKVTPQREGLSELTVRLSDGSAGNAETVYVIPVLVPQAATATPAASPPVQ